MFLIPLACIPLGFALIIVATLLHEPEERKVQDALEHWWVALDDQEKTWTQRAALITQTGVREISAWLDELFGPVISLRVVIGCLSFSLSSMLLMSFGFGISTWFKPVTVPIPPVRLIGFLLGGGVLFWIATQRRQDRRYTPILSITVAFVMGGVTAFFAATSGRPSGFYAGLVVGGVCNYVILALARRLAAFGSSTGFGLTFAVLALLNAAFAMSLLVAPMFAMNTGKFGGIAADVLGFGAISNFFAGVAATSFMLLALTAVLPAATWSLLSRPLYAVARFRVLQNRRLLFFAGSSLIVVGVPALSEVRSTIVSLFMG